MQHQNIKTISKIIIKSVYIQNKTGQINIKKTTKN